jgi:hypothetical protein
MRRRPRVSQPLYNVAIAHATTYSVPHALVGHRGRYATLGAAAVLISGLSRTDHSVGNRLDIVSNDVPRWVRAAPTLVFPIASWKSCVPWVAAFDSRAHPQVDK